MQSKKDTHLFSFLSKIFKIHQRLFICFGRFDCLGRRVILPTGDSAATVAARGRGDGDECEAEREGGEDQAGVGGEGVQLIPGMLRSYDTSTGLFSIRYAHGNR